MDGTQVGYFLLCILGGLFVVGVPWSGIILLNLKREKKPTR
jgi:hypothetical protein